MLAKREQVDVLDNHHLVVVLIKDGIVQDICGGEMPVMHTFSIKCGLFEFNSTRGEQAFPTLDESYVNVLLQKTNKQKKT